MRFYLLLLLAALLPPGYSFAQSASDTRVIYLAADVCGNDHTSQYFILQTGAAPLNLATSPVQVSAYCPTGGSPRAVNAYTGNTAAVNTLNTKTGGCGTPVFTDLFATQGGVAPANSKVLIFVGNNPDLSALSSNTFASLCGGGSVPVVFGNYSGAQPFFFNNNPLQSGCGAYSQVDVSIGGNRYAYRYDPAKLAAQDGAFVAIDVPGLIRYGTAANCGCPALTCAAPPIVSISGDLSLCEGEQTTITATAQGGGYTYAWSNGVGGNAITVSPEISTSYTVTLTSVAMPECAVAVRAQVEVFGLETPDLEFRTATGGAPCQGATTYLKWLNQPLEDPYATWNWTTPSGATLPANDGFILNEQTAGVYQINITWDNGCLQTASLEVGFPAPIPVHVCSNAPLCPGEPAKLEASDAGPAFSWSGPGNYGANSATVLIPNAQAGLYQVTVTDENGCTRTGTTAVLYENCIGGPMSVSVEVVHTSCGEDNGKLIAVPIGGYPPYQIDWLHLAGSNDPAVLDSLPPGTYIVQVYDTENNMVSDTVVINESSGIRMSLILQHTTCGLSNGSIVPSPTGATLPYTIDWADLNQSPEPLARYGLPPGGYSLTVTDALGCTDVDTDTILASSGVDLSQVVTPVSCFGTATGAINITTTGGQLPYSWNWADLTTAPEPEDRSGLGAGIYVLTVTDAGGCTDVIQSIVTQPSQLSLTAVVQPAACGPNGSITLTVTGGTAPYSFNWLDINTSPEPQNRTGLPGGTYKVWVTDAAGCTDSLVRVVPQYSAPQLSAVVTNVSCFGGSTGAINVTATVGTAPWTWNWADLSSTPEPEDRSNLTAGTYSVTLTDANGCTGSASWAVTQPATALAATSVATAATCGSANGGIVLNASGGTSPYTYDWADLSGASNPQHRTNIVAGTYTVTVTDSLNCTFALSTVVGQTGGPSVTAAVVDVLCRSTATGAINITVTGGTTPYTYNWQDLNMPVEPEDRNLLVAGTYTVTITSANGCTTSASWTLTQPAAFVGAQTSFNHTSCGLNNGAINVTGTGGVGPYTYDWSNIAGPLNPNNQSGLGYGIYTVTVSDNNSCTFTSTFNLQNSTAVSLNVVKTNTTCGYNNGTITVTASGGSTNGAPTSYTYDWLHLAGNSNIQNLTGLDPSTYYLTVTSSEGCSATSTTTIASSAGLNVTASLTHTTCGSRTGAITVSTTGGTAPYTYDWAHVAGTSNPASVGLLLAGTYTVTVTSANSCTMVKTYTINNSGTPPTVNLTYTNPTGIPNGTITLSVSGGASPYTYDWQHIPGTSNPQNLTQLAAGTYTVTVKESSAQGCTAVKTQILVNQTPPQSPGAGNGNLSEVANWPDESSAQSVTALVDAETQVSVYPNPATSTFNVLLSEALGLCDIEVRDALSRLIHTTSGAKEVQVQSEKWPPGAYFIAIRSAALPPGQVLWKTVVISR